MKMQITDHGDPSVGLFGATFEIDVPFERVDADSEMLEGFRNEIAKIFSEYGDFKANPVYDFEDEEMNKKYLEGINPDINQT